MPGELRVLVVADDPLARGGLAALLAHEPALTVTVATGDALEDAEVLVWDIGTRGAERLVEVDLPVVALVPDETVAAEALAAGARAVLGRSSGAARMVAAIHAVAAGLVVLDDTLAAALLRPAHGVAEPLLEGLTPRELEVLALLATGLSNKAIAESLGISEHTAKFHVNAILAKLGVDSRTEAVVRAARLGLVVI